MSVFDTYVIWNCITQPRPNHLEKIHPSTQAAETILIVIALLKEMQSRDYHKLVLFI